MDKIEINLLVGLLNYWLVFLFMVFPWNCPDFLNFRMAFPEGGRYFSTEKYFSVPSWLVLWSVQPDIRDLDGARGLRGCDGSFATALAC
jgi:hypothetical protein